MTDREQCAALRALAINLPNQALSDLANKPADPGADQEKRAE
ncbi:hypothetical protein ACFYWU_41450 [Streptomyces chrestomyceticus]